MKQIFLTIMISSICTGVQAKGIQLPNPEIKITVKRVQKYLDLEWSHPVGMEEIIATLGKISGKNVMISHKVKHTPVPIYAWGTYTHNEVYEMILTALETIDLTLEERGRYLRVVRRDELLLTPKR